MTNQSSFSKIKATPKTWILLRGLLREQRHWGSFPLQLQDQLGVNIICPDIAGNGKRYQQTSAAHIATMLEDVRSEVQITQIQQPVTVLGLSMGGMIASEWLASYPEELSAAVLVNTSLGRFSWFYQRLRPNIFPSLLRSYFSGNLSISQKEQTILNITRNQCPDLQAVLQEWIRYAQQYPVSGRSALNQLFASAIYRGPASSGTTPVLLLSSKQDHMVNPVCSHAIAKAWQCPLEEHAQAGHDLPLDDGQWVIDTIQRWLLNNPSAHH
jgi:pimeloyl-ACP methyl ester carboxylesterase